MLLVMYIVIILLLVVRDLIQHKALSGMSFVLNWMQRCVTVARSPVKMYAVCASDQVVPSL